MQKWSNKVHGSYDSTSVFFKTGMRNLLVEIQDSDGNFPSNIDSATEMRIQRNQTKRGMRMSAKPKLWYFLQAV